MVETLQHLYLKEGRREGERERGREREWTGGSGRKWEGRTKILRSGIGLNVHPSKNKILLYSTGYTRLHLI